MINVTLMSTILFYIMIISLIYHVGPFLSSAINISRTLAKLFTSYVNELIRSFYKGEN